MLLERRHGGEIGSALERIYVLERVPLPMALRMPRVADSLVRESVGETCSCSTTYSDTLQTLTSNALCSATLILLLRDVALHHERASASETRN